MSGKGAHVEALDTLEALDWRLAGVRLKGAPHSIFQIVNHVVFWQDWVVDWLNGLEPPIPKHAAVSWPGQVAPANSGEWKQAIAHLKRGMKRLDRRSHGSNLLAKRGKKTHLQMLQTIAAHNSYHLGQVVVLRQMLAVWPPPSGGLTW
jgi:uncharacterized damage-inducible protein DinB